MTQFDQTENDEEFLQRTIKDIDLRLNTLVQQQHNREGSTGGGPILHKHKSYDLPLQMKEVQRQASTSPFD